MSVVSAVSADRLEAISALRTARATVPRELPLPARDSPEAQSDVSPTSDKARSTAQSRSCPTA